MLADIVYTYSTLVNVKFPSLYAIFEVNSRRPLFYALPADEFRVYRKLTSVGLDIWTADH